MHTQALIKFAIVLGTIVSGLVISPAVRPVDESLQGLARSAILATGPEREQLIRKLRAHGPAALEALFAERAASSATSRVVSLAANEQVNPGAARIDELIDRVAGQRYGSISRLFWYTDLEQAKAAAQASNKPILSLRLLGRLDEEFSCANSRFFRTMLYANASIRIKLERDFILHWQSVCPAPRITIDFGDGRKIERTITGNSIHYLLNSSGEPLDALPGLYAPAPFLAWLEKGSRLAADLEQLVPNLRAARFVEFHQQECRAIEDACRKDVSEFGSDAASSDFVRQLLAVDSSLDLSGLLEHSAWERIARHSHHVAALDVTSSLIIATESATIPKRPTARAAGVRALSKLNVEGPLLPRVANPSESLAIDSVRNEYVLHKRIHTWFLNGRANAGIDRFNEAVYRELFLMPSDDPWLGLARPDVYSALTSGGLIDKRSKSTAQAAR